MPDAPAPLQPSSTNAQKIEPTPNARSTPAPDAMRSSQLERASRAYADTLLMLAPGPDFAADLMREQFAEQVSNPERYHRISEVENSKGLRIGDNVILPENPERIYTVTSICERKLGGERRIEVHTIARDTYGGWVALEAVQKVPPIQLETASLPSSAAYRSQTQKRVAKAIDTRRTNTTRGTSEQDDFQANKNRIAVAAAVKWGFKPAALAPDQDGWITPRFEHVEFAVDLTTADAHVEITVAQAPNDKWASAAAYSEKHANYMCRPFPNGSYRQHPNRDAAVREQLAFLHGRISDKLFAQVELAAGIESPPAESSIPAPTEKSAVSDKVEQARILLNQFIAESGDLFGTGGIHLLAGPVHAPQRIRLMSLLRDGTKIAPRDASTDTLRDAFYLAAGISGSTPTELEDNFTRWCKRPLGEEVANAFAIQPTPMHAEVEQADARISPTTQHPALRRTLPKADDDPDQYVHQARHEVQKDDHSAEPGHLDAAREAQYVKAIDLVADWVTQRLSRNLPGAFTARELFDVADQAFGGTQTTGRYTVKDAYDAMEAGIHRAILEAQIMPGGGATSAARKLAVLEEMLRRVPPQTHRTAEAEEYQQFSSPPPLAFVATWAANITHQDVMLEPSAGTGAIATFGTLAGAEVIVNELSSRRAAILKSQFPKHRLFTENAEQLHNALPDSIRPTVIVMNPPFSATAGRLQDARPATIGAQHVEQALRRLAPGGRLVAIVGSGMAMGRPNSAKWWDWTKASYTVRANIGIDGKNYAKYGTTFDIQLLVIDKTGPTRLPVLMAEVDDVAELLPLLEEIRHDRPVPASKQRQITSPKSGGEPLAAAGLAHRPRDADAGTDAMGPLERSVHRPVRPQPSGSGTGRGDAPAARSPQAGKGDRVPDQSGADGTRGGGADRDGPTEPDLPAGRSDTPAGDAVQQHGGDARLDDTPIAISQRESERRNEALSDAIYEHYLPQRLSIDGAHSHPGKLVQSAAMAATDPPVPNYIPSLPRSIIEKGQLSLPQLEAVVYAGQAHEQRLPGGQRRGFFIGDGTGVGKGRTIAGIILDNLGAGRRKAVWISEKSGLLKDARRDFAGVGGDPAAIFAHGRVKPDEALPPRDGVLFASYTLLTATQRNPNAAATSPAAKTRLHQLLAWLGADFDGVIALDESHNMANSIARRSARGVTPPSAKALAGIALQDALPNARVVYVSATGATEVANLAYATRLGLWGEGTPFATVSDFIGSISAGGVAAMELVSRDMKAMGVYLARSLSFDGVTYDRLEHTLTPLQTDIYNELAGAWQTVLKNVDYALSDTGQGKDGAAKSAALSQFWGAHQRFFNQIITSMQMPTVIAQARAEISRGHAVVMQLVNTNEAAQERQLADMAAAGTDLDELDFTPRQNLIDYVKTGFPVQQYKEYKDDNGNVRSRPVLDAAGRPMTNRDMEARRDALVSSLATIRVPDNPIDSILNAFGPDMVAEVTGRSRRFILERDGNGDLKPVEQKRSPATAMADADDFMDDKKTILVFSDAGGTGYSFHADLTRANQRKRIHFLIQPGWRADKAIQGMGRTHRTNEASQPHYVLPTTNLEAQRRFISSIARRLDQLGALTKGQRQTGSQGLFDATDNLESDYARRALRMFFIDMYGGHARLDFGETSHAMGLNGLIDARTGALNESKLPSIPQFLNRLLSLKTAAQDRVFGEFFERMEQLIESAKERGDFDHGVETIRAQSIQKLRDEMVHADVRTGAETHYVELALHKPTRLTQFDSLPIHSKSGEASDNFLGYFRNEKNNQVFALQRTGQGTNEKGTVVTRARQFVPTGSIRHVENADLIAAGALGRVMIKRRQVIQAYGGRPFEESWTRNGKTHTEHSATAATELERGGMAALERLATMPGIASERRMALAKIVERIKAELVEKEVEREVPAYTRLTESTARDEWNAELASAPRTHVQHVHMITGALLPIWDRIPGSPRVIRTQTDDGERLLGRTVTPALLAQTLKNLGVGSDLSKLPAERIVALILEGAKAVLVNGWEIATVCVSRETRIEINATSMSENERRALTQQGAFCERIQWRDRVFVPTGGQAATVLARIIESKPVAEIFEKKRNEATSAPVFCQTTQPTAGAGKLTSDRGTGFDLTALRHAASSIQSDWPGAPPIACVQSASNLPFPAPSTAQGAFHLDTIYLVADNISNSADFQFVVGHEALGHAGLRAILDLDSLADEMTRLRRINPSLDRAARQKATATGCGIELATEEALCDMAGAGQRIHGLQSLILMIQRGLRKAGLHQLADWFESKSQSETMDLLGRARTAVIKQTRESEEPVAPSSAVFACGERRSDQPFGNAALMATDMRSSPIRRTARSENVGAANRSNNPRSDPFGLRKFGLNSLNKVRPAYRDTENWRAVPSIMSLPSAVAEIRANLARIENTQGGTLYLDQNGNIAIVRWAPRADNHSTMRSITTLADRHGLGVLTMKSAFMALEENDAILRAHGFSIWCSSVTWAATGRDGPPNSVTFVRKPAGAPLFSHLPCEAPLENALPSRRAEDEASACSIKAAHGPQQSEAAKRPPHLGRQCRLS